MDDEKGAREIIENGAVKKKRRFDARDWKYIAEYVIEEWERRKNSSVRSTREKHWKEIDRQIEMEPNTAFKTLPNGKPDAKKLWMAEMELPLQAQALEVLTADARRMMEAPQWFRAHAETTDDYYDTVDFSSIILGDQNEVPTRLNQDNADKLIEGWLKHQHRQYDLFSRIDRINAEAFKYGMGVGRGRMQTKSVFIHDARGVKKQAQRMPVLAPCSIKNLYLDEPMPSMHSAQVLGQSHIAHDHIKYENLILAANKGSSDPHNEDGGWMPDAVRKLEPDDNGYVQILEMEGDIVVPRKTVRSVVLPNAICTVAIGGKSGGKNGAVTKEVIRFRFSKAPQSSYLLFPYQYEGADDAYPTSPLMKGRPVQMMATDALNRLMDSAALKNAPPISYGRDDMTFNATGGPEIYPYAQWETMDGIKVHNDIGGDPGALSGVLSMAINLYSELTGVLPSRLGAQTVSHTTAFAKEAEIQRGATRTVDYVNQVGQGPMEKWLDMSYRMGRDALGANDTQSFYIDAYGGFVEIGKEHLPENAVFEWFGASGPQEEQAKSAAKLQSFQMAMQMDQVAVQMGEQPSLDIPSAIREVLRAGKWTDLDVLVKAQVNEQAPQPMPGMEGGIQPNPGAATVALQQLAAA